MMVITMLFSIWVVLVGLYWLASDPSSAPQQAALAAQVLVLVVIPYVVLATFQRARALDLQDKSPKIESEKNDEDSVDKAVYGIN